MHRFAKQDTSKNVASWLCSALHSTVGTTRLSNELQNSYRLLWINLTSSLTLCDLSSADRTVNTDDRLFFVSYTTTKWRYVVLHASLRETAVQKKKGKKTTLCTSKFRMRFPCQCELCTNFRTFQLFFFFFWHASLGKGHGPRNI